MNNTQVDEKQQEKDIAYMHEVIKLALKGSGWTAPNPLVGCVIVKDDKVLATGYHHAYGEIHAERDAINKLSDEQLGGSTLYVNLEPCVHTGKQPPCADLIIQKKIKRVVIGILDVNPLVFEKSLKKFKDHNIEVTVGVLEELCYMINRPFFWFIKHKRPFVCLKVGMSIDGKIATQTGDSKYITNRKSLHDNFMLRHKYQAILVSKNTVNHDDPLLNVRDVENEAFFHHPFKIVLDSNLEVDLSKRIFNENLDQAPVMIFCSDKNKVLDDKKEKIAEIYKKGIRISFVRENENGLVLGDVLDVLGNLNIISLIVEAGPHLASSFINDNLVNVLRIYMGSILIGGQKAPGLFYDLKINQLIEAKKLKLMTLRRLEDDVLLEYDVKEGMLDKDVYRNYQNNFKS